MLDIFVLRLLVVPLMLFPFFQILFTSNKMQLKLILFLFLARRDFSGNKL